MHSTLRTFIFLLAIGFAAFLIYHLVKEKTGIQPIRKHSIPLTEVAEEVLETDYSINAAVWVADKAGA